MQKFFNEFHIEPKESDGENGARLCLQFYIGVWWYAYSDKKCIIYSPERDLLIEYMAIGENAPFSYENRWRYQTIHDVEDVEVIYYPDRKGMDTVVASGKLEGDLSLFQLSMEIMPEEIENWKRNNEVRG